MTNLTENNFIKLLSLLPNGVEKLEEGKRIPTLYFYSKSNNKFYLSYHLVFPQKNLQFNIWFDRISYVNTTESVTISCYDRNEMRESLKNKHILHTNQLEQLDEKIQEILSINS